MFSLAKSVLTIKNFLCLVTAKFGVEILQGMLEGTQQWSKALRVEGFGVWDDTDISKLQSIDKSPLEISE